MAGEPSAALVEGLSGAAGGVLGLAVTYPLLAVATRLQLQTRKADAQARAPRWKPRRRDRPADARSLQAATAEAANRALKEQLAPAPAPAPAPALGGAAPLPSAMLPALLHVLRTEGAAALFVGIGTACASLAVSNSVYYALYAALRDATLRHSGRSVLGGAAALPVAALAGALNVVLTNPLWVLVTRLQAAGRPQQCDAQALAPSPPTPLALTRAIYAEGGVRAFWKGVLPALLLVSNPVVQFAVYEGIMARVLARAALAAGPGRRPPAPAAGAVFAAGAAAKLAATLATYPFLVIKSRQQGRAATARAVGPLTEAWLLAREEGLTGALPCLGCLSLGLTGSRRAVPRHRLQAGADGAGSCHPVHNQGEAHRRDARRAAARLAPRQGGLSAQQWSWNGLLHTASICARPRLAIACCTRCHQRRLTGTAPKTRFRR
jgi:adenine nucleotide transporter 17